jgi:hypothetical protein
MESAPRGDSERKLESVCLSVAAHRGLSVDTERKLESVCLTVAAPPGPERGYREEH